MKNAFIDKRVDDLASLGRSGLLQILILNIDFAQKTIFENDLVQPVIF